MIMSSRYIQRDEGFTLLEVVTAIALFSILLLITVSVFTTFVDTQRRDIDEQAFQEDIRLAMDLFNREARGGFGDTFETDVVVGPDGQLGTDDDVTSVYFRNQDQRCVRYFVSEQQLLRNEASADNVIVSRDAACSELPIYDPAHDRVLTGDDSTIITIRFQVQPSLVDCDNFIPPEVLKRGYITVMMTAEAASKGVPLQLQSTVTSRQGGSFNNTLTCTP